MNQPVDVALDSLPMVLDEVPNAAQVQVEDDSMAPRMDKDSACQKY